MSHTKIAIGPLGWLTAALLAAVLASGCAELPEIQADNACGNGVLEPFNNEDCEPGRGVPDGLLCGPPTEENGCRFICQDDDGEGEELALCPAGWGCGAEGFCLPPSGRLSDIRPVPGITTPLAIGDFDGDHFIDIAGVQEPLLSIAYGNPTAQYQVTLQAPIDSSPNAPVIGDLDRDGQDDLIVHAGSRVNLYRGQNNQTVVPYMVPSFGLAEGIERYKLTAVGLGDPLRREHIVALELVEDDDALYAYLLTNQNEFLDAIELESPGDQLPERTASADLFGADGIEEFAIAPHRGQAVVVFSLVCDFGGLPDLFANAERVRCVFEEITRVLAPPGWQLGQAGTFIADVDGDEIDDLLFGLQGREGIGVGVALNNGAGFEPAYALPVTYQPMMGGPVMPGAQEMGPPVWLLGVADVNDDGFADLLTEGGIIEAVSDGIGEPLTYEQRYRPTREWQQLQQADLNRDGYVDLVATTGPSVLTLLNDGDGIFNQSEMTVESAQLELYLGDFDGDLFPDALALVDGRLLIGFNDGRGLTDELVEVVSLAGNVQAVAYRGAQGSDDAIDDVLLIVEDQLGVYGLNLEGSGTRRLSAPLDLPAEVDAVLVLSHPARPAVGLTIEEADEGRLFRVASVETLAASLYDDPPALETEGDCVNPMGGPTLRATFADPDGGYDRIVTVQTAGPDMAAMMESTPWTPRILVFDGDDSLTCSVLENSPLRSSPDHLEVADINGDGAPDLIIGHGASREPGDDDIIEGGLAIYYGTDDGMFETSPTTIVRRGAARNDGSQSTFRGAFTALDTHSRPGVELILVYDDGLYLLGYDVELGDFAAPERLPTPRLDYSDVEALLAFDANLDGVDDLLLSGPRQSAVILQTPCTAFEAAEGECTRTIEAPEAP